MMEDEVTMVSEEGTGLIHVFPVFGKTHVLDGIGCWCHPELDVEQPKVVIHNVEN
jgi:hypothetical protein